MSVKSAVYLESVDIPSADFDTTSPQHTNQTSLEKQHPEPKTARDGCTVLIPQPSSSPDDPSNWSAFRKNAVLGVVIACSFLPDYGSVTEAVTLTLQAK